MKRGLIFAVVILFVAVMVGCNSSVPQGKMGRVKTANGWQMKVLPPGHHTCWGRDTMYFCDTTEMTYNEKLMILVGGKVNLDCVISVRCGIDTTKEEQVLAVFDRVLAGSDDSITHEQLYTIYLQLVVKAVPQEVFGKQPDVQTVIANKEALVIELKKRIFEGAAATPMKVTAVEVTNYDWPDSITKAQERLFEIQMEEERESARVRADLKKAEGQLKVEEAKKLVELKKAEAVAESIAIIKECLAGAPEYLAWHQIRMLSEAAQGPNNAFIIVPYNTPIEGVVSNVQLRQLLNPPLPDPVQKSDIEPKKK